MIKRNVNYFFILIALLILLLQGCSFAESESEEGFSIREDLKESVQQILGTDKKEDLINGASDTEKNDSKDNSLEDSGSMEAEPFIESGYYYSQLTETDKLVYSQIYRSITQRMEVKVSTLSSDAVDRVFNCVCYDHPEIFYVDGYSLTSRSRDDVVVSLSFSAKYIYDEVQTTGLQGQLDLKVNEIVINAPTYGTDYDKVKYVFDTIIEQTDYVEGAKDNQNMLSVLLYNESVCSGYAKATQYLLNQLGVETTMVIGSANGESHGWNLVKADNAWYYLDTTWGDADFQTSDSDLTAPINYDYFMIDSATLNQTHIANRIVPLPECVARDDNYYIHENLYFYGLEPDLLKEIFDIGYDKNQQTVQFKCANSAVYDQMYQYLLDDQKVFDYIRTDKSVTYSTEPKTNTFCFWLFK